MKKLVLLIAGLFLFAGAVRAQTELRALVPAYWIVGTIPDASGAVASGRYVDFYRSDADLDAGNYAQAIVVGNRFILNAFQIWPVTLTAGETYNVATERRADNFGAAGTVRISGRGWDEVTGLTLTAGGGIEPPRTGPGSEPPPSFNIWFGNRIYQRELVSRGKKFTVSANPKIKVTVGIDEPYAISNNINDYSIVLDPGTSGSKNLALGASNMTAQAYATSGGLKSFAIEYALTESDKLSEGGHTFSFTGRSSGAFGVASTSTALATVEVLGGPLRLVSDPLTFPSPFSITKQGTVTIQYELSANANIEVVVTNVAGERIKRYLLNSGAEGGSAGINKLTWNGRTDQGYLAGNAIYLGTIVARDEGRLLGKFKLTIVD